MKGSILNTMNEDGVSETIGAVLLIGLTVVGVTLISVILFSQPIAEELPAVDIIVSNNESTIMFQHNGGDSLGKDEFTIFVEGNAVDPDDLHIADTGDGEWPWSVGETLQYVAVSVNSPLSENIRMTYGGDSGILIRPAFIDVPGTNESRVDTVPGPLPVYTPGATSTPSPAEAGVYVAESVLTDSQIIAAFSTLEKTGTIEYRYLNFTIDSENSTMNIPADSSVGNLADGTKISILTGEEKNGNRMCITGVGTTFFGLRFERAHVRIGSYDVDSGSEVEIKSAWIPKYKDLESNLAFRLGEGNKTYELYIDGALDPHGETGVLTIMDNVQPTDSGMFVINTWSSNDDSNAVILAKADIEFQ